MAYETGNCKCSHPSMMKGSHTPAHFPWQKKILLLDNSYSVFLNTQKTKAKKLIQVLYTVCNLTFYAYKTVKLTAKKSVIFKV
jgi:hypothetical protein